MIKYEHFLELENRLAAKYEKEVTKNIVFDIEQTPLQFYNRFRSWMLKAKIGFQEGVSCEIVWVRTKYGCRMEFVVFMNQTKGFGKSAIVKKQYEEINKLTVYYDIGKEIFLDWVPTVPELRLLHVLSPEKVLTETENIEKYKANFIQLKG